jgi:hypothetical protein
MTTYRYEALDAEGGRVEGSFEAESPQAARNGLKEQGLLPVAIRPAPAGGAETASAPSSSPAANEVRKLYAYGWKIRVLKLLVFHIPFLLLVGLGAFLFCLGKPVWLAATLSVAGLMVFGFAGFTVEQWMLGMFVCPRCQTRIQDWSRDSRYRVCYDCSSCGITWNIGYKQYPGRIRH